MTLVAAVVLAAALWPGSEPKGGSQGAPSVSQPSRTFYDASLLQFEPHAADAGLLTC